MRKVLELQAPIATALSGVPQAGRSNDPVGMGNAVIQAAEKVRPSPAARSPADTAPH